MEYNAYITSIAVSAFYGVASLRFLRLSRRTRKRPELYLGLYFGLSGLYYLGLNVPNLVGLESSLPAISVVLEWAYVLGVFPYLLFIRCVFRPEALWADLLVGVCSAFLLVGTALGTLSGPMDFSLQNPWFLAQWVGYSIPCVWLGFEAARLRQSATRRARIGLCPPLVANRYLLLVLFGCFQFLACLADLSWANDIGANQTVSMASDALLGITEIASVSVLWLAFFAPAFYTHWITRNAVILPTPMDG